MPLGGGAGRGWGFQGGEKQRLRDLHWRFSPATWHFQYHTPCRVTLAFLLQDPGLLPRPPGDLLGGWGEGCSVERVLPFPGLDFLTWN